MLHLSKYNFITQRHDNTVVGYNAKTGVFALLSDDVKNVLEGKKEINTVINIQELVNMGFIHFGGELACIREKYINERNKIDFLDLTLAPTLSCNFRCNYCYQNKYRNNAQWDENTVESVYKFIKACKAYYKTVSITWYGGEPLIVKSEIISLTKKIKDNLDINDISIITNGTLLDLECSRELSEIGIHSAQVSFDSLYYRSPYKRGVIMEADLSPSPILKNVMGSRQKIDVTIRINVSADNIAEIPEMIQFLEQFGLSNYYLARADNSTEDNINLSRKEMSYSIPRDRYAHTESENLKKNKLLYYKQISNSLTPKSHACGATSRKIFVIDAGGYVSRCWNSAGQIEHALFNVNNKNINWHKKISKIDGYSPFDSQYCINCNVLPLCMGGCSYPVVYEGANKSQCTSIKFMVKDYVKDFSNKIKISKDIDGISSVDMGAEGL